MRIGIYGGTFDPPHLGHNNVAINVSKILNLETLIVVPTAKNPLKDNTKVSSEHRYNMCKLMFEKIPNIIVSDYEIYKKTPVYTVDTLEYMHKIFKDDELFLIIGDDNLKSIHKWKNIERICELAKIALCPRLGYNAIEKQPSYLRNAYVYLDKIEAFDMSSTYVREKFDILEDYSNVLDEDVVEYIRSNKLYERKNYD